METETLLMLIGSAVLIACGVWVYLKKKDDSAASAQKLMADMVKNAVNSAKNIDGIELDFSEESLAKVDALLCKLSKEIPFEDAEKEKAIAAVALMFGAYSGEVIRKNWDANAQWKAGHKATGPNSFPLNLSNGHVVFPVGWCFRSINGSGDDSVANNYKLTKEKYGKPK